ncbi:MAG: putative aromatic hydrocarbon dioxygenase large subunit [Nocardioidaceae bacterium]|nr:putative aromatic hydrocarbon dioxygenase large subunit [Nocardioidaceae bacterium]
MTVQQTDQATSYDLDDLIRRDRVHGSLYTEPQVFDQEMAVLYERAWVFVAHESEIKEPGDYLTRRIGRQPVIVARAKDGSIRVMLNRCTHRANLLCRAPEGNAALFRCPFHGWTFSNDGRLQGVSFRGGYDQPMSELRDELGLTQASQVGTYGGFVFANLFGDAGPLEDYLGEAKSAIDRLLALSPEGTIELCAGWMKHRTAANWKIVNEVQVDGYHPLFVHESVYKAIMPAKVDYASDELQVATRDLGGGHSEVDYSPEYRAQDAEFIWFKRIGRDKVPQYVAALEERHGAERAHEIMVDGPPHTFIWPNLFLAEMHVMMVEPLAADDSIQYTAPIALTGADEVNRRALRNAEGAMGPAGFLIADDAEMGERNQLGLAAREPEWVLLARGFSGEQSEPRGLTSYDRTSETPQRGMWSHYKRCMTSADSNSHNDGGVLDD